VSADRSVPVVARSKRDRVLILIGAMGPLGHMPASGTVTVAALGLPLFWLTAGVPLALYLPALTVFTLAAVWIHHRGDQVLGEKDSGTLVWDEVVGFMVAVIGVPITWKIALVAFFLERALDILKVWPARWVEDHWPGGWGVVGDDVVAGLYTLGVLHGLLFIAPQLLL